MGETSFYKDKAPDYMRSEDWEEAKTCRDSDAAEAIEDLDRLVARALNLCDSVADRLHSVCSPDHPKEGLACRGEERERAPYFAEVNGRVQAINKALSDIESVLDRLQV